MAAFRLIGTQPDRPPVIIETTDPVQVQKLRENPDYEEMGAASAPAEEPLP